MIGDRYLGFFSAASVAAGALIGLLFVAVSLRSDAILGAKSIPAARALAASAFTALVDAFFISLLSLVPNVRFGIVATVMAGISILNTIRLHLYISRNETHLVLLAMSLVAFGFQAVEGVLLAARPHDATFVSWICYSVVAAFAVALVRAWSLLQGKYGSELAPELQGPAGSRS